MLSHGFVYGVIAIFIAGWLIRLSEDFILPILITACIYAIYRTLKEINNGSPDSGDF